MPSRFAPAALLALLVFGSYASCQAANSPEADKQAAKAWHELIKEAEKAIKTGNIDQLKAILEANPDLATSSVPQSKLAGMIAAPLIAPYAPGITPVGQGANAANLVNGAQQGVTLLRDAAYHRRIDAAELLLTYHANVNARDGLGYTPLHEAIMALSPDMVRLLLDHGAEVNARAGNGDPPLRLIRWEKFNRRRGQPLQAFIEIEQLLLQHGATL